MKQGSFQGHRSPCMNGTSNLHQVTITCLSEVPFKEVTDGLPAAVQISQWTRTWGQSGSTPWNFSSNVPAFVSDFWATNKF